MNMYTKIAYIFLVFLGIEIRAGNFDILVDGKAIGHLGRSACSDDAMANIRLFQTVNTDLILRVKGYYNNEKEKKCETKIDAEKSPAKEKISQASPIPQKTFLPEGACKDTKGKQGKSTICLYDVDGELKGEKIVRFNTLVPKLEGPTKIVATNGEIKFEIQVTNSASNEVEICYAQDKSEDEIKSTEDCLETDGFKKIIRSAPNVVISGLEDYKKCYFKLRLADKNLAERKWSKTFTEEPVETIHPLDSYEGKGGLVSYGCNQKNHEGSLFILLLILAAFLLRNSMLKKSLLNIFVFIFCFCLIESEKLYAENGQFNIGLLGSIYRPNLDSEKGANNFYKLHFRKNEKAKEGPLLPLFGVEFDWHMWDGFGSLQLGFGVAYTFANGYEVEKNVKNKVPNTSITMHIYQLRPQLTYMLDEWKESFPIFPYVRAGIIGQGYSFVGGSMTANSHKNKPHGINFGYQIALGIMLMMDFLEPSALKDASDSINHIYLKGELSYTKVDNFGLGGLNFSSKDVMGTNLPLMWTFGLVFEIP